MVMRSLESLFLKTAIRNMDLIIKNAVLAIFLKMDVALGLKKIMGQSSIVKC